MTDVLALVEQRWQAQRDAYDAAQAGPVRNVDWREQAACRGENPDWWDLSVNDKVAVSTPAQQREAVKICRRCPVRSDCFTDAEATLNPLTIRAGYKFDFGGRPGITVTCRQCDVDFATGARKPASYCSQGCKGAAQAADAKARAAEVAEQAPQPQPTSRTCERDGCAERFEVKPLGQARKYCGARCRRAVHEQGARRAQKVGPLIAKVCRVETCQAPFKAASNGTAYCGEDCRKAGRRATQAAYAAKPEVHAKRVQRERNRDQRAERARRATTKEASTAA